MMQLKLKYYPVCKESGNRTLIPNSNGTGSGGEDSVDTLDKCDMPILSEYQAAMKEWIQYQQIVKKSKYFPTKLKKEGLAEIRDIRFGVAKERGEDLMQATHSRNATCQISLMRRDTLTW
jgi:hypothetical protein